MEFEHKQFDPKICEIRDFLRKNINISGTTNDFCTAFFLRRHEFSCVGFLISLCSSKGLLSPSGTRSQGMEMQSSVCSQLGEDYCTCEQ